MSNVTEVTQKAAIGSKVIQIAEQNNNYGITAKEASKIAIDLFIDNFPKLQEKAIEVVQSRVDEFCKTVIENLKKQDIQDFTAFSDPDMQYILYKTQRDYARFGTNELLNILSTIITNRVIYNNNQYIKVNLDKAAQIAASLSSEHFDYLSFTFLCKQVKFGETMSIEEVKEYCEYLCSLFEFPEGIDYSNMISFLDMLGCFSLKLGYASDIISQVYNLNRDEVEKVIPNKMRIIPSDYALNPAGMILAIANINEKTELKLKIEDFIHM